jgi:hypothetical protein
MAIPINAVVMYGDIYVSLLERETHQKETTVEG